MRYDIKLLEKGLADAIKERDDMIGRGFPFIYQEEIDKVQAIVDQVGEAIKLLKDSTFNHTTVHKKKIHANSIKLEPQLLV